MSAGTTRTHGDAGTLELLADRAPMSAQLGTDPAHWGEGVGSALVRHVVDDPAHGGEPAYLETETAANVPFYARHGFVAVERTDGAGNEEREPDVRYVWPGS